MSPHCTLSLLEQVQCEICMFGTRGDFIKRLLWRTSIARILIVGFFLLVLLPTLLADCYFFRQIYAYILQEQFEADGDTVNLIVQDIQRRVDEVEEFTNNIVYNGLLINFLQVNYSAQVNANYEKYLYFAEYVEHYCAYNRLNGYINQTFFMMNDTIPEDFDSFYRISRIENQTWYADLMESDGDSRWIYADTSTYFDHINVSAVAENERFIYLRVVRNYTGDCLGVMAIEVDADYLLQSYDVENLYILHEPTERLLQSPFKTELDGGSAVVSFQELVMEMESRGVISAEQKVDSLGIHVSVIDQPKSTWRLVLLFGGGSAIVMLGMILLTGLFGVLLHACIDLLRKCIYNIQSSVLGEETMLIPESGNNEFSWIIQQFNRLEAQIKTVIAERIKLETAEKEMQLRHMQSLISPHFFYNTLDVISSSILLAGEEKIADAIANFGQMMRYAFREDKMVTLENEIRCIESFVMLQKVRYQDRIELKVDVEKGDFALRCSKFILQPVVENAILHGMRPDGEILHIHLHAKRVEERILEISVEDDGVGIAEEHLEELLKSFQNISENADAGFGIGLYTVNQQLKIHYGDDFMLKMRSELGRGTIVILPIRISDGD